MTQKSKDSSFLGDVQQSPINSSMPVRSTSKQLIMGLLALAVVAGLAYGGFRWYKMRHSIPSTANTTINTSNSSNNTATSTDYSPNPGDMQLVKADVTWQKPVETKDLGYLILSPDLDAKTISDYHIKISYYLVGKFTSGPYKDGLLYIAIRPPSGPGGDEIIRLAVKDKTAYVLERYSQYYAYEGDSSKKDKVMLDPSLSIPALDVPDTITSNDGTKVLKAVSSSKFGAFFSTTNLIKLFDSRELGPIYGEVERKSTDLNSTPNSFGFYAALPDGTTATFYVEPPFMSSNTYGSPAKIIWNSGGKNTDEYSYQIRSGCGSVNYGDVVGDVSSDKGLIVTGKTEAGDPVYEYSDANTPFLKKLYNEDYIVGKDAKDVLPYEDFIKKHPVFFWRDSFGRYVRFTNNQFLPLGECAKPVIYLYPPQTEKVSVGFGGGVTLTYTEPKYNNGWQVTAEPDGTLTNSDGKTYPYLFWEGRGLIYESPKQGFMVKREDLDSFLSQKLSQFGLVDKEIADFKQYWLPFMQDKPYYFVGFHTQNYLNKLIPENVTPKPDTVIRVLMDFNGLDKPIKVSEPKIFTPTRQGFTLVEWGGVRR